MTEQLAVAGAVVQAVRAVDCWCQYRYWPMVLQTALPLLQQEKRTEPPSACSSRGVAQPRLLQLWQRLGVPQRQYEVHCSSSCYHRYYCLQACSRYSVQQH